MHTGMGLPTVPIKPAGHPTTRQQLRGSVFQLVARTFGLLVVPVLGALVSAPAHAVSGFTGVFAPSTWVVVNTNPSSSLGYGTGPPDEPFSCANVTEGVGCIDTYTPATGEFSMIGLDSSTGVSVPSTSTTTLTLTNTYWRPYLITFNWSYTGSNGSPVESDQTATIMTDPGFVGTLGSDSYFYTSSAGDTISGEAAVVYLPPGATLSFTATTNNTGAYPVFSLDSFDAVEVPAPLPISGGVAAFSFSRRLRRRRGTATAQGRNPLQGHDPDRARQHQLQHKQRTIQSYAALLGRPLPAAGLQNNQLPPAAPPVLSPVHSAGQAASDNAPAPFSTYALTAS